jgi:hypothetical protein
MGERLYGDATVYDLWRKFIVFRIDRACERIEEKNKRITIILPYF